MTPEEQLDRLIEQGEPNAVPGSAASDEITARFVAAQALVRLQEVEVPPEFAARLEARLRARVRSLAPQDGWEIAVPRPPEHRRLHRRPLGRRWVAALAMVAMLLLACLGTFAAAARSLPGDSLYRLKQAEDQLALAFAGGPQERARVEIGQLHSAIADLRAVVTERRGDDVIAQALEVVVARTRASQDAVEAIPAGADREAAQRDLSNALADEAQTLRHLLPQVDWPVRLAFTQQLGTLGEAVPTITQVTVNSQGKSRLLIIVTGTNFAPHATLVIGGHPRGTILQSSTTQLVVVINASDWHGDTHVVGVLNPDGTAVQVMLSGKNPDHDQDDNDDRNKQGTPGATSTPEPKDDNDEHSGSGGPGSPGGTATPTRSHDDGGVYP